MKRSPILALVAVILSSLAFYQYGQLASRDAELAKLRGELVALRESSTKEDAAQKKVTADAEVAVENAKRLTTERDDALAKLKEAPPVVAPAAAAAPPENKAAGFAKGLSEMFKGEDGKKMLRSQSEFGARMIFGDFVKSLDPATSEAVMNLLAERQTAMALAGMEAMSAADPTAASAKVGALKKEFDDKLRGLIGDKKMEEMNAYERTAGDRMMFTQVESQFASAGTPLSAEQRTGILNLIQAERLKLPVSPLERGQENPAEAIQAMRDEKAVTEWLTREEQLNASVVTNASKVISPDQVLTLDKSLKQMMEMKRFGLKMWQSQQTKPQ